jgi:uncharacterized protein (TIGR00369 family)
VPSSIHEPSHDRCFVCGCDNDHGLHLEFLNASDGSVTAEFQCNSTYQGYTDVLHGGVVATLLDGAMTNCLFAHQIVAVTAELTIRYLFPVYTGQRVTVKAWITKSSRHLHVLAAELTQDGKIYARALGKFRNIRTASNQHSSQACAAKFVQRFLT